MPWKETDAMSEREKFLRDHLTGMWSVTVLSERYGISRQTAHKWLKRIDEDGVDGLQERSRRPRSSPNQTPENVRQLLLATKHEHPTWGPKKVLAYLERRGPKGLVLPARSTVDGLFLGHGLVQHRHGPRRWNHPGRPTTQPSGPNDLWTADFKGEFRTRDGIYCYPLTVVDLFSRFLLVCKGLFSVRTDGAKPAFERIFREVGLPLDPDRIITLQT